MSLNPFSSPSRIKRFRLRRRASKVQYVIGAITGNLQDIETGAIVLYIYTDVGTRTYTLTAGPTQLTALHPEVTESLVMTFKR